MQYIRYNFSIICKCFESLYSWPTKANIKYAYLYRDIFLCYATQIDQKDCQSVWMNPAVSRTNSDLGLPPPPYSCDPPSYHSLCSMTEEAKVIINRSISQEDTELCWNVRSPTSSAMFARTEMPDLPRRAQITPKTSMTCKTSRDAANPAACIQAEC